MYILSFCYKMNIMNDRNIIELESSSRQMSAVERKARRLLGLEPTDRLRAIEDDPDARAIVKAFAPQDLLITIKQVGESDAISLIELASPGQLRFFSDVEWWIGDTLDPERILEWLSLLIECGDDKVIEWLQTVDAELLVTVLRKFMIVNKDDEGTPPPKSANTEPPCTIDGIYQLHLFGKDADMIITRVLSIFRAVKVDLYMRIMEAMVWETGSETEKLAIKWRNGRLRDIGIPDLDEAMEVYRFIDENTFRELPPKGEPLQFEEGEIPPRYPLATAEGEQLILQDALREITDPLVIDGITQELAHLVNRVLVADREDLADHDAMFAAAQKVRATVSMGLLVLTAGDITKSVEIITAKWLLHIFQLGHSQALKLTRRAYSMARSGWMEHIPEEIELLGEPLGQIFKGLKNPRPLLFIGGADSYRSFLTLDEIDEAGKALDEIEYLGELFFNRLKLLETDPSSWDFKQTYPVNINFETVLRTAFVNAAAGRGFIFGPLEKTDIVKLMKNAFESEATAGGRRFIPDKVKKDMHEYFESIEIVKNDKEREIADTFISTSIESLEEELGRIDIDAPFDPKFIQGLLIKK